MAINSISQVVALTYDHRCVEMPSNSEVSQMLSSLVHLQTVGWQGGSHIPCPRQAIYRRPTLHAASIDKLYTSLNIHCIHLCTGNVCVQSHCDEAT